MTRKTNIVHNDNGCVANLEGVRHRGSPDKDKDY